MKSLQHFERNLFHINVKTAWSQKCFHQSWINVTEQRVKRWSLKAQHTEITEIQNYPEFPTNLLLTYHHVCRQQRPAGLTVRQDSSSPDRIFSPSSTMSPAITALVVAMAGMMFPAIARRRRRKKTKRFTETLNQCCSSSSWDPPHESFNKDF